MSAEDDKILAEAKAGKAQELQEMKQRDSGRIDEMRRAVASAAVPTLESPPLFGRAEELRKKLGECLNMLDQLDVELWKPEAQ